MEEIAEKTKEKEEMKMLGVRITKSDHDILFEIANHEDRSVAGVVRMLIKRKIANYQRSN